MVGAQRLYPMFRVYWRLHPSRGGLRSLDALAGESGTVDHGQRERVFG